MSYVCSYLELEQFSKKFGWLLFVLWITENSYPLSAYFSYLLDMQHLAYNYVTGLSLAIEEWWAGREVGDKVV